MLSVNKTTRKALVAGIVGLGTLAAAGIAQAQSVVVRSTGPSATVYPQGKKLPADAKVTLKSGDRLTVLDKAGTRVLAGPGSYTLDGKVSRDQAGASRTASMVSAGGGARARTGAVRGAGGATAAASDGPGSVWYVDVSKGGTYCIANPDQVVLWRPNRTEEAAGKITAPDGKVASVTWTRGNPLKLWPKAEMPIVNGSTYEFSDPVGPTVKIRTMVLKPMPEDQLAVAGMLADMGCNLQLDVIANAATPMAPGA